MQLAIPDLSSTADCFKRYHYVQSVTLKKIIQSNNEILLNILFENFKAVSCNWFSAGYSTSVFQVEKNNLNYT